MITAPYFSQFASRELVNEFLHTPRLTATDPRWADTGWSSSTEYAYWAWKTCGVACLRSLIGATGMTVPNPATMTQDLINAGAYVVDSARGSVHGMIYTPAIAYLTERWLFDARLFTMATLDDIRTQLEQPNYAVIASVAPGIRDLMIRPRLPGLALGGHLILITGFNSAGFTIHNPSGYWPLSQADVTVGWDAFASYFAGRGIVVQVPPTTHGVSI